MEFVVVDRIQVRMVAETENEQVLLSKFTEDIVSIAVETSTATYRLKFKDDE